MNKALNEYNKLYNNTAFLALEEKISKAESNLVQFDALTSHKVSNIMNTVTDAALFLCGSKNPMAYENFSSVIEYYSRQLDVLNLTKDILAYLEIYAPKEAVEDFAKRCQLLQQLKYFNDAAKRFMEFASDPEFKNLVVDEQVAPTYYAIAAAELVQKAIHATEGKPTRITTLPETLNKVSPDVWVDVSYHCVPVLWMDVEEVAEQTKDADKKNYLYNMSTQELKYACNSVNTPSKVAQEVFYALDKDASMADGLEDFNDGVWKDLNDEDKLNLAKYIDRFGMLPSGEYVKYTETYYSAQVIIAIDKHQKLNGEKNDG